MANIDDRDRLRDMDGVIPWPAEFATRYRRAGYWQDRPLGTVIDDWAARFGTREALVVGEARYSYRDLAERSADLARALAGRGLKKGDRVVVQLPNSAEFVLFVLALFRLGAIPVMALPAHRRHEISYLVDFAQARAYAIPDRLGDFDYQGLAHEVRAGAPGLADVFVAGEAVDADFRDLRALLNEPVGDGPAPGGEPLDAGDVALFLLSGGTTGLPKFIPRTHNDYIYNFRASARLCGFDSKTVYMASLPVAHNFPLGCPGILGTFDVGGRVVLAPSPRADVALPLIAREGVTATAAVPAIAIQWMDWPELASVDLSALALLQVGGARLNPEAARRITPTLGCKLQQVFGMAEGLLCYTRRDDVDEIIINTQGRPLCADDEIRVVDEAGDPVASDAPGELLVRGPYTVRGYYKADDHNARAFNSDGFYRTGDIVRRDAIGNFIVEGRAKDLINRGGEKISAEEIENLMLAHTDVQNVAAIAMPDPVLGEKVCAYVQPQPGARLRLDDLRDFLLARGIARFKIPERLELIERLPLTNIGKVDKKALRADIAAKLGVS